MLDYRDESCLKHIIDYCGQIEGTLAEFGDDREMLDKSNTFKNALCLCVLQIGELSGILSDDFKNTHNEMPWRDIKIMRNIVAHRYGTIDAAMLWETAHSDIEQLKNFCLKCLAEEK